MKKLLALAFAAALVAPAFALTAVVAEEEETENPVESVEVEAPRKQVGVWPAFFAICETPSAAQAPDIVGIRLTIPFSTKQESITGIDVGCWGRAQYFEGLMCNILRNDVKDRFAGVQVGLYNSVAQADLLGLQAGLWNEAGSLRGAQVGFANVGGCIQGVQVGVINRAEELYGFQVGLINVVRDAEITFCPFVNVGF